MIPTFSSLPGSNATNGASSTRNAQPPANHGGNDDRDGGFDALMQPSPRNETQARSPEQAASRRAQNERPADHGQARKADDGQRAENESRAQESRSGDGPRRAGSKSGDEATNDGTDPAARDAVSDDATAASSANPTSAAPAEVATANAAAPASLPEQLLALLNGLAAAPAAAAPVATDTAAMLSADATATAPTQAATRPVLPTLQTGPVASNAPAAANDANASAFAQAMAAVDTGGDAGAGTVDLATAPAAGIEPAALASTTNNTAPVASVRSPAAATVATQTPVALDSGFDDNFGSRIAWMAEQRVGHAEIRVSPDNLGTIDVRLQLDGNRVNAEFHSTQADVRHALESSLPRLREMLGQHGLQLGQADVGQRQPGGQPSNGQASGSAMAGEADRGNEGAWAPGPAARATRGLLDEYA